MRRIALDAASLVPAGSERGAGEAQRLLRVDAMGAFRAWFALGCLGLTVACGASTQEAIVAPALSNDAERATAFEATARLLDEHPEWVDEMYAIVRKHDVARHRMLADAAADLARPPIANETGALLSRDPAALRETLIATVDAAQRRPAARQAIERAVEERAAVLARMIAERDATLAAVLRSSLVAVDERPASHAVLLSAMRDESPRVARVLAEDPGTLAVLTEAILRYWLHDRPALEGLLQKVGLAR